MRRISLIIVALAGFATPALAQDTAAVDPDVTTGALGVPEVTAQCQLVADDTSSGVCLSSTQAFLDGLTGDPAANDQAIGDLVAAIVPLIQDDVCNAADEEIAQAVRLAAARATDAEQIAELNSIADEVEACEIEETADIGPNPPVPGSAA